ncbi:acyl-CoA dehydrogenase family protein [Nigerium massiliense]|uniref:acyl-CoA dehydrogenase family protein n=1 Tax=Nigerium massiliense TaxID=1522317 RepID=UPI0006937B0C|nr:acyl-CoA dehydrogenase family protein [Nigerium massiliense]
MPLTATTPAGHRQILTDDLLGTIRSRAAAVDAENVFPFDDLADLRAAGYLTALVPEEFGGAGLTIEEIALEQARLAGAAPATALAVNMHQIWLGVARHVHAGGDASCDFLFTDAMAGEVFAFGVSEAGNDLVLFGSISEAAPQSDGCYAFTGTKIFTTLGPAWTRFGTFGADRSDPASPVNVWAFLDRDAGGITVKDDWDTLGMRGTQSRTTVLDGAPARPERVVRRVAPGPTDDPFVMGIFLTFEILLAAVYYGIGQRAIEVAVELVQKRTSVKNAGAPYAHDPDIRWRLADAAIEQDAVREHLLSLARDLDARADRPLWMPQASSLKSHATEVALRTVEKAIRASGGSSYRSSNELSRLYRDVAAGLFHPSDDESVHAAWANALLGPVPKP